MRPNGGRRSDAHDGQIRLGDRALVIGGGDRRRSGRGRLQQLVQAGLPNRHASAVDRFHLVRDDILSLEDVVLVEGDAKKRRHALGLKRPVTITAYESFLHDIEEDDAHKLHGPGVDVFRGTRLVVFDEVVALASRTSTTAH